MILLSYNKKHQYIKKFDHVLDFKKYYKIFKKSEKYSKMNDQKNKKTCPNKHQLIQTKTVSFARAAEISK